MTKKNSHNLHAGLTLVEVLVAAAIILVFLIALFQVHSLYLRRAFLNIGSIKGALLAEEGLEAVRFLRDSSWNTNIVPLALGTNYNLVLQSNTWSTTTASFFIDNTFERVIVFSSVNRDANGDIVSTGGALDPGTKLVTVSVSWRRGEATTTKSVATYITNILNN